MIDGTESVFTGTCNTGIVKDLEDIDNFISCALSVLTRLCPASLTKVYEAMASFNDLDVRETYCVIASRSLSPKKDPTMFDPNSILNLLSMPHNTTKSHKKVSNISCLGLAVSTMINCISRGIVCRLFLYDTHALVVDSRGMEAVAKKDKTSIWTKMMPVEIEKHQIIHQMLLASEWELSDYARVVFQMKDKFPLDFWMKTAIARATNESTLGHVVQKDMLSQAVTESSMYYMLFYCELEYLKMDLDQDVQAQICHKLEMLVMECKELPTQMFETIDDLLALKVESINAVIAKFQKLPASVVTQLSIQGTSMPKRNRSVYTTKTGISYLN
jgi:hypothetical protein